MTTTKYKIAILLEDQGFADEDTKIEDLCIETCIVALRATKLPEYFEMIELTISLSNDKMIRDLNNRFKGKDKPTNVLSFPNNELTLQNYKDFPAEHLMLGDIMISYQTLKKEAEEQGKEFIDHLHHLLIHAILHLAGYDHENPEEAEKMEALEIELLKGYGIKDLIY